jgi:hypothetical protein
MTHSSPIIFRVLSARLKCPSNRHEALLAHPYPLPPDGPKMSPDARRGGGRMNKIGSRSNTVREMLDGAKHPIESEHLPVYVQCFV